MLLARFRALPSNIQVALTAAFALLLLGGVAWWRLGERVYLRLLLESPSSGRCDTRLNRAVLDRSLALGTRFLLTHQKPEGNFDYEYNWHSKSLSSGDNETRQAGALWGLALLYQATPKPEIAAAIERGLAFFDEHSTLVDRRIRCPAYPGSTTGGTGTVALVALTYIDYLRAAQDLPEERRHLYGRRLDEYMNMLVASIHPSNHWYADFDPKTCEPGGDPEPYSDGEALLAMVKAAKYLGQKRYLKQLAKSARAGNRNNITLPLASDPDSDITKGYYQWATMAFYELATSDFPEKRLAKAEKVAYGDQVLELADWMIDTHKVLTRSRNTGYAFEGLVYAYALAKERGDARQANYACAIDVGLERLISWQVGGPLPNRYTEGSGGDPKSLGGIQNSAFEPGLRIDVTQHQMHATRLALQYVYVLP